MRTILLFLTVTLAITMPVCAQSLLGPAAQTISSNSITVSWSIGEPIIGTYASSENIISIGFQQAFSELVSGVDSETDSPITLYPNPAAKQIHFQVDAEFPEEIHVEIWSPTKVLIVDGSFTPVGGIVTIDVNMISSGLYYACITTLKSRTKNLRFIKL